MSQAKKPHHFSWIIRCIVAQSEILPLFQKDHFQVQTFSFAILDRLFSYIADDVLFCDWNFY